MLCINLKLIYRLITETAKQSQDGWNFTGDWSEIEVFFLALLDEIEWNYSYLSL